MEVFKGKGDGRLKGISTVYNRKGYILKELDKLGKRKGIKSAKEVFKGKGVD